MIPGFVESIGIKNSVAGNKMIRFEVGKTEYMIFFDRLEDGKIYPMDLVHTGKTEEETGRCSICGERLSENCNELAKYIDELHEYFKEKDSKTRMQMLYW
jgi:hypothetical protein